MASSTRVLEEALRLLAARCPRLVGTCYWAGTSAASLEELHHRDSFDLDFHTFRALQDVRPILAEIQAAFPRRFALVQPPDAFGSGFSGVLTLPGGEQVTLEVLANYEDVADGELVTASTAPTFRRASLDRYLADKIQCVAERVEARDLVDIDAVLRHRPRSTALAKKIVADQDAALLAERLLAWTDEQIAADLRAYRDADPADACRMRDTLLEWLRSGASGDGSSLP